LKCLWAIIGFQSGEEQTLFQLIPKGRAICVLYPEQIGFQQSITKLAYSRNSYSFEIINKAMEFLNNNSGSAYLQGGHLLSGLTKTSRIEYPRSFASVYFSTAVSLHRISLPCAVAFLLIARSDSSGSFAAAAL
jgi:hypothetical protein